jgi:hypothetical protein
MDASTLNLCLEWSGAVVGVIGATLLAAQSPVSKYGWAFFFAANLLLIAWAIRIDAFGLLVQQGFFTLTSLLGLYRSGLIPSFLCHQKL